MEQPKKQHGGARRKPDPVRGLAKQRTPTLYDDEVAEIAKLTGMPALSAGIRKLIEMVRAK